jgi:hypothetical protein
MLTDTKIKAEIKTFAMSNQRRRELVADGRRGSGRLVLTMRRYNVKRKEAEMNLSPKFAVERYVRFHMLNGDRRVAKVRNYDTMGLGDGRRVFNEEYAPKIARGDAPPKGIKDRRLERNAMSFAMAAEPRQPPSRALKAHMSNPLLLIWQGNGLPVASLPDRPAPAIKCLPLSTCYAQDNLVFRRELTLAERII